MLASIKRYLLSSTVASAVTVSLILIMNHAIKSEEQEIQESPLTNLVGALPVIDDIDPNVRDPRAKPPEPPIKTPEAPRLKVSNDDAIGQEVVAEDTAREFRPMGSRSYADGEAMPVMTVPPDYPERMLARGVEGWVLVEFAVDELGRVQNPRVIDAYPSSGFNQSALKAVKRYKYKPRVVDGRAVSVTGLQQRIVFSVSV